MKAGWQFAIATLLYCLTGWLMMLISLSPAQIASIWPPTGIALAAVLLWGHRFLPVVVIGAFLLSLSLFSADSWQDYSNHTLALISLSSVALLRVWLGSILVKRFVPEPYPLASFKEIGLFFLLAGPVSAFVPVTLQIYIIYLSKLADFVDTPYFFAKLWVADSVGVIIFLPVFFVIFDRQHKIWQGRILTLALPLTLCFLISSTLSLYFQQHTGNRLRAKIEQQTQTLMLAVQNQFDRYHAILQTGKELAVLNVISKNSFNGLAQNALQRHPDLLVMAWLETRPDGQDVAKDFILAKPGVAKKHLDTLVMKAVSMRITTRSKVMVEGNNLYVFMPVFQSGLFKGLIVGVFDLPPFLQQLAENYAEQTIVAKLYENTEPAKTQLMLNGVIRESVNDQFQLSQVRLVNLADSVWTLNVQPGRLFVYKNYPHSPIQLLSEPGLWTGLITFVLIGLTSRNEAVNREVRRRTEELEKHNRKLRNHEKQYNKLLQTQSVIIWRANPETYRFVYVNDEAESILGYPISDWKNEADFWWNHIHPEDCDYVQRYWMEERVQRNADFEYRMIAANGNTVWVKDIFTKILRNGKVSELYGIMLDITNQKLAEEEFRVAAITFESQQGIMITDKHCKILRVNKAFSEITGFAPTEVIGKDPKMLSSGRHDKEFFHHFWEQLIHFGKFEGEIWNRRKNGEIYPEWQTVTAVINKGEVSHYVSVFSDITQKKEAEDKIHNLAFYDALTGLPNRRLLLDRFEQEIAIARRHKQYGAVIFLDLDHFKILNDSQGHLVGDELLIQVANRLSSVLREEDTPARLGGDEFVILLHANSENLSAVSDHARTVAEKIRKQLNTPFMLNNYQHQISTSIGITLFPEGHETPDMILQQADTAMYRSKASGRNTISFFQPSMQEAADQRLKMEQDMRAAIEKEAFLLYFQAQVDQDGVLLGAEVLIRWEHPEYGIVSPTDFIPVAEESSLILDIGQWVVKKTCQQIKAWQDIGYKIPRLSMNVSSRQFRQQDFVEQIKNALIESSVLPQTLGIELTESIMIIDMEDTVAKMRALQKLGVSIAVDDFGTGYSSLIYLKCLPLDVLKIDRGFVRDILTDINDVVIVETIISMAKHLKLRVIAEGVESAEQFDFLKKQGCSIFQGFYFGKPVPADEFFEQHLKGTKSLVANGQGQAPKPTLALGGR